MRDGTLCRKMAQGRMEGAKREPGPARIGISKPERKRSGGRIL